MDLFLVICTGLGLAASVGLRPFLPMLATGVAASADVGIDFDGTDFAFLESGAFLLVVLVLLLVTVLVQRRLGAAAVESGPLGAALSGVAIALGALLFAAALQEHGDTWWPGLVAGAAIAALAQLAVRSLFARVRSRADQAVGESLVVYQDGGGIVAAAAAIFVPPVSLVLVGFLGWLYAGGRRRGDQKYAGLRILR